MYAVTISEPGGPDVLRWTEVPDPVPGDGEVLIDVAASAINRADLLQRAGFYEPPPGTQIRSPGDDPREMQIFDGWSHANSFSLDRQGFELREFENGFERFDDAEAVRSEIYGPVGEFVRTSVGARRVVVRPHNPLESEYGASDGGA
jgi:hypothetical protein